MNTPYTPPDAEELHSWQERLEKAMGSSYPDDVATLFHRKVFDFSTGFDPMDDDLEVSLEEGYLLYTIRHLVEYENIGSAQELKLFYQQYAARAMRRLNDEP